MATLTLRVTGSALPDVVWDRYADTRRWACWAPPITSVRTEGGTALRVGLTGTVHGPLHLAVPFEVTAVDTPARSWSWRVRLGPSRITMDHGVTRADSGCTATLRLHGLLPVIIGYAPAARLSLRRLVDA